MAVARPLSDTPAAIRKRNSRAKLRELAKAAGAVPVTETPAPPVTHVTPVTPPPVSAAPWHETKPVTGPGPEAFATPLVFPANENEPDAKPEPFATPPPPPEAAPPPPMSAAEAAPFALGVTKFFEAGAALALIGHAPELAAMGVDVTELLEKHMSTVSAVVYKSAENVAQKYNLRIPYQDEMVVAGAIGVAAFGFTRGRKRIAEMQTGGVTKPAPVEADASTPANENAPIDVDAERPIRPPAAPRDDDDGGAE
jgi:hypothetical protein